MAGPAHEIEQQPEEGLQYKTSAKNQYVAAAIVSGVASLSIGTVLGFSAILLPQLEDEGIIQPKSQEASWIASLSNIGQLFGSVLMGILAGAIGRKKTIMALCVPLLCGWIVVGVSGGNVTTICAGRVLQGVGIMSSVTQVYLVEVADAKRRGMFGGSGALTVSAGITLVYTFGALLPNWRWVCLACGALPVLIVLLMPVLPETPNWLVLHNKRKEAYQAIRWLRGPEHDIEGEIVALENAQKASISIANNGTDRTQKWATIRELSKPHAYKPFILLVMVFVLQQSTGTFAVIFYAVNVFQDLGVASDPYVAAILTGLIRLTGSFLGTLLLKKFARKSLMMFSALTMCTTLGLLAITVYYKETTEQLHLGNTTKGHLITDWANSSVNYTGMVEKEEDSMAYILSVLPLVEIILYILFYGLGVGTVPWLLLGELCPVRVKGLTAGCVACAAFATIFLVVKLFPMALLEIGQHGTYLIFAAVCLLMAGFTHFFLPETRGKSMAELQTLFDKSEEEIEAVSGANKPYGTECLLRRQSEAPGKPRAAEAFSSGKYGLPNGEHEMMVVTTGDNDTNNVGNLGSR